MPSGLKSPDFLAFAGYLASLPHPRGRAHLNKPLHMPLRGGPGPSIEQLFVHKINLASKVAVTIEGPEAPTLSVRMSVRTEHISRQRQGSRGSRPRRSMRGFTFDNSTITMPNTFPHLLTAQHQLQFTHASMQVRTPRRRTRVEGATHARLLPTSRPVRLYQVPPSGRYSGSGQQGDWQDIL